MKKEIPCNGLFRMGSILYEDPDVYKKYLSNMRSGFRDFRHGTVTPFTGFPAGQFDGICITLFYDAETTETICKRLLMPIEESASRNNILIYSGRSFWTLHTIVSDLRYLPGKTPDSREESFDSVLKDPKSIEAFERVQDLEITFDALLPSSVITLATSYLPTQILEARRQMAQVAEALHMGEKDFTNIVHITLTRIAPFRKDPPSAENLLNFGHDLMVLHHNLLKKPIKARVSKVEIITNSQIADYHLSALMAAISNSDS